MKKKDKKVSITDLSNRLESDESAWLKQLSAMGDFAKYWRQLEAHQKKNRRSIVRLQKTVQKLDQRLKALEGSKPTNVA